jgi:hypothetical protein
MQKILILVLSLMIASCSVTKDKELSKDSSITYEQAFSIINKEIEEQNPAILSYLAKRMEYENSISLDSKGNCYAIPGEGITLVMRINKNGVIDLVLSNIENEKSKCFRRAYFGTKFEKPSVFPIYRYSLMGYKEN